MEYLLDLDRSFIKLEELMARSRLADPMNATGGSLVTVVKYLWRGSKAQIDQVPQRDLGAEGQPRIIRAIENVTVLRCGWIPCSMRGRTSMPGLGDAGDRINGMDEDKNLAIC